MYSGTPFRLSAQTRNAGLDGWLNGSLPPAAPANVQAWLADVMDEIRPQYLVNFRPSGVLSLVYRWVSRLISDLLFSSSSSPSIFIRDFVAELSLVSTAFCFASTSVFLGH